MHTRREFLKCSFAAATAATIGSPGLLARAAAVDAGRDRPNVLFIMTDQQFADAMSCRMGTKYIHTPAMDSLAESGTLFSRAYSPNPVCMPARGSIFTGRYPHETGITRNARVKLDTDDFVCMGTYFRRAGYETAYFGKWHLVMSTKDVAAHGFESFGDARPGSKYDPATAPAAIKWITGKHEKPFLAVVSFLNPHNICEFSRGQRLSCGPVGETPPPDNCPPVPANLAPVTHETDTLTVMREAYHKNKLFPVGDFTPGKWRQLRWGYYRLIEKVDALIGQVLDALDKAGLAESTVVIFTSDHGDCAGAHGWNQKTVFYDESSRVPLIISRKGRTAKAVCDRLVNTGVDILPTMMAFAGIDQPAKLTGRSLMPIVLGENPKTWRDHVIVENDMYQAGRINGVHPEVTGRMVRTDRYKYCLYETGERREALFDMRADPLEATNLAEAPAHKADVLACRKMLADFAKRHNDSKALAMLAGGVGPKPFPKELVEGAREIIAARAAKAGK